MEGSDKSTKYVHSSGLYLIQWIIRGIVSYVVDYTGRIVWYGEEATEQVTVGSHQSIEEAAAASHLRTSTNVLILCACILCAVRINTIICAE